jgi:hypothetical protein
MAERRYEASQMRQPKDNDDSGRIRKQQRPRVSVAKVRERAPAGPPSIGRSGRSWWKLAHLSANVPVHLPCRHIQTIEDTIQRLKNFGRHGSERGSKLLRE